MVIIILLIIKTRLVFNNLQAFIINFATSNISQTFKQNIFKLWQ